MRSRSFSIPAGVCGVLILAGSTACAVDPWPAETVGSAVNLTPIEGAGTNDFHVDLSGAFWNSSTRRLWLCRNGPTSGTSKLWAAVEDGGGSFEIDERDGNRGEWTGFGDLEGVTQAVLDEDVVYLVIEGAEVIREYDVSTYGTVVLNNEWDTDPFLPGSTGAEGITFVPDTHLEAAGFVDAAGEPYSSTGGMGGLMFVSHQAGGAIYAFDLNRADGTFVFVGEYMTGYSETAGLEFDRSIGLLYAWHDSSFDVLSVLDLTSVDLPGGPARQFNAVREFDGPNHANNEGIAVMPIDDCTGGERSFFMTVDDGGADSLFWYRQFEDGCPGCPTDTDDSGETDVTDLLAVLATWGVCPGCPEDVDEDGDVDVGDLLTLLGAWGPC